MRASIFVSAAAFALASAQDSAPSLSVDPAPQTAYLTQTNSLGVVTGMPAVDSSIAQQPSVVTDQPAVVTSQPLPANIPAVGPGVHTLLLPGTGSSFNQTRTVTVSANNSTTLLVAPATTASGADATGSHSGSGSNPSKTGADASGPSATRTGTGSGSGSTGAASNVKAAAGSLVGFGAFMAAFL